jgi:hypothetical protein
MGSYEFTLGTRRVRVTIEKLSDRDGIVGFSNVEVMDLRRGRRPIRAYRHIWYTSEARLARLARASA